MTQSILDSTKKILGIEADYTAFDLDVMTHINSSFLNLQQIGVGPEEGFMIEDNTATWDYLLGGDPRLNAVKTYVYLKCRLAFDPPGVSFAIAAIEKQIEELEWRLNVSVDTKPLIIIDDEVVVVPDLEFDGGAP